jgi:hypothetical protein
MASPLNDPGSAGSSDLAETWPEVSLYLFQDLLNSVSASRSDSESFSLSLPRGLDTLEDGGRRFAETVTTELFIIHIGNFDMDINSI